MITFKSRDDQLDFVKKFMNRLIHHRFIEKVYDVDIGGDDPYVYRHFVDHSISVTMNVVPCGTELRLTVGNSTVLYRSFHLVEADPLEVVTLSFIDFCQRAEEIERILNKPTEES